MMKKKNVLVMAMMGLAVLFCGTSCSEDENTDGPNNGSELTEEEMDAAIATYVDGIVLPTYKNMLDKVTIFKNKVDAFVASGNQNDLNVACQAWRDAREPWEFSEAHLGGPATNLNLDPSMDSWPLDKEGINTIIKSGDFSELEGYDDDNMELRGFHTAEYMLFFDGQPRDLSKIQDEIDLTNTNLKKYLQIVVNDILKDTETLYNAWAKGLEDDDTYSTPYGEALKKHDGTNGMTSAETVLATILSEEGGMANIANEVGEAKIGDPITNYKEDPEKGLLSVESWYSWNSITDYSNNIKGVKNCYLGSLDGKVNASSLSALVKKLDTSLDTKVQEKINAAIAAIENIPAPFRNHLDVTKYPQVTVAQDACAEVVEVLKEVRTKLGAN
ncbi:peptidase M75 [Parabacteroides sp. GYB001]|uniref:imelysin family protein n=1 Tax=Parabacteroides leei TaxID=2939491 RepID=UPI0020180BC8|nr:imelysin family protein [Parabacteroides leei]MCL3852522.1 peptidase M75 [Parabacteroides leei]